MGSRHESRSPYLYDLVTSVPFNLTIACAICVNAATIGYSADYEAKNGRNPMRTPAQRVR